MRRSRSLSVRGGRSVARSDGCHAGAPPAGGGAAAASGEVRGGAASGDGRAAERAGHWVGRRRCGAPWRASLGSCSTSAPHAVFLPQSLQRPAAAAKEALAADADDFEALAARLALGVRPLLSSCVPPGSSRAASGWLDDAASVAAVSPKWLVTAASAPAASSLRMMSRCPFSHAFISAVVPCFVCELTGMPREAPARPPRAGPPPPPRSGPTRRSGGSRCPATRAARAPSGGGGALLRGVRRRPDERASCAE